VTLRQWLILRLAGSRPVMLNMTIRDGEIVMPGRQIRRGGSLVCNNLVVYTGRAAGLLLRPWWQWRENE
jgi:hypothetical protein